MVTDLQIGGHRHALDVPVVRHITLPDMEQQLLTAIDTQDEDEE